MFRMKEPVQSEWIGFENLFYWISTSNPEANYPFNNPFFFANNQIQRFDLAAFHHNNKRNIEQIDAHEMQQPQL